MNEGWQSGYDEGVDAGRSQRQPEVDALRAALAAAEGNLATFGMVELAVRNPNVSSYITEWEGRALRAEAKLAEWEASGAEMYAALKDAHEGRAITHATGEECYLCRVLAIVPGSGYALRELNAALADERRHAMVTLHALAGCVEWMGEDGCDCGSDDPRCALCEAQAVIEKCAARRAAEVGPKAAPAKRADGGPFGKWEIEPAITSEFDLTCTNDDNEAFDIAERVLERLWDEMEPGDTRTLRITLNAEVANG